MFSLSVQNVTKKFGETVAVRDLSFDVEEGKIFGILGPNGAGKTTAIRMIAGIFYPDEGKISILGSNNIAEVQNRIGYLPEERGLYKKLKVADQLAYFAELKGLQPKKALEKARHWLKLLDAEGWLNKKIQELSKGMQQKIQFVATILHNPDILILDEPFTGFDPINVETFKQVILDLKKEGKTILLSTHIMEQAEQLCDDVCLINNGIVLLKGSLREVKARRGKDTIVCEYTGDGEFLSKLHNVKIISMSENRIELRFGKDFNYKEFIKEIVNNLDVSKIELTEPSLREIFIEEVTKMRGNNGN
jgi:ABC-2 type transport system ATP-binding protein